MEDYTPHQGAIQDKLAQVRSFRADRTVDGIRTRQRLYVSPEREKREPMMSEVDQVKQQIAAFEQEQQRLRQLSLEAQASLAQLSKQQGTTSLQRASLEWVEEQERRYRDTQRQWLALLERRWELADELAQAQRQLEQLQRREALPDDDT